MATIGLTLISALLVLSGQHSIEAYTSSAAFRDTTAIALHNFGVDLFCKLAPNWDRNENVAISPMSMYAVLSILLPGLQGSSYDQVYHALGMSHLDGDGIDRESDMCGLVFQENANYELHRANRIYSDLRVQIKKSYKQAAMTHHKSPVKKVDFVLAPRKSRKKMNRYVAKHTNDEITELIPQEAITQDTKIFLVNAIYLKVLWQTSFIRQATTKANFQISPTRSKQVSTMYTSSARCFFQPNYPSLQSDIVVLPFKGNAMSMIFIVPTSPGNFAPLESATASGDLRQMMEVVWNTHYPEMETCEVHLPKFKVHHTVDDLIGALQLMNVSDIFSPDDADLSLMTTEQLYVSDMRHQAVIKVDELGVKATGATSIGISGRSYPTLVQINRPFMYMIRHEATGALLFMGRIVNPK